MKGCISAIYVENYFYFVIQKRNKKHRIKISKYKISIIKKKEMEKNSTVNSKTIQRQ